MELNISPMLRRPGIAQSFDVTGIWPPLNYGGEEIGFNRMIRFQGKALHPGGDSLISLEGTFTAELVRPCARCLEPASQQFAFPVQAVFAREEDADQERFPYAGETLELDELLQQELLLRLPMRALCEEDCRGLCPQCGQPLASGACGCGEDAPKGHPLLRKWLQENKEV